MNPSGRLLITSAIGAAVLLASARNVTLAAAPIPRPNVLLIMADDMGWSDIGCYGSEIDTPNLDRLAAGGVRFTQFYNGARCCPTRAALLTGLYAHQAGVGGMVNDAGPANPGYRGRLNERCVTLAEVLKGTGYRTYMSGKWHVGEARPHWPVDRGFDRYYGLVSGAMNYFDVTKGKTPKIKRGFAIDGEPHTPPNTNWYATDAFADHALDMLKGHPEGRPFFLYLAFNAPHWPLHAPENLIRKYEGRYRTNWLAFREARHRRQIEMGLIGTEAPLSPPDSVVWDELDAARHAEMDRKMAIYAAQVERLDWNIGRVVDWLKQRGAFDNTVIFFLSDNGASAEGGQLGGNFRPDLTGPIGSVDSYHSYGQSWANVSNTPFRRHKTWVHEGGISSPFIVHWPAGLKSRPGTITRAVGHIIDLMPTVCELAGAEYPKEFKGQAIQRPAGTSLAPILRGEAAGRLRTLYWEHVRNAAIRDGDWKLVRAKNDPWELYDLGTDRSELRNLAKTMPDKVRELSAKWEDWAVNAHVKPYPSETASEERSARKNRKAPK